MLIIQCIQDVLVSITITYYQEEQASTSKILTAAPLDPSSPLSPGEPRAP